MDATTRSMTLNALRMRLQLTVRRTTGLDTSYLNAVKSETDLQRSRESFISSIVLIVFRVVSIPVALQISMQLWRRQGL